MSLKCYIGNLDGTREGMVLASSQKKAAQIAQTSLHYFRGYWSTISPCPIENPKWETLYTRLYTRPLDWHEGRCPNIPRPTVNSEFAS